MLVTNFLQESVAQSGWENWEQRLKRFNAGIKRHQQAKKLYKSLEANLLHEYL